MKKCFRLNGFREAIVAIISSYVLLVLRILIIPDVLFDNDFVFVIMQFGLPLLCISIPIMVATFKYKFKLLYLAFIIPIIYILFIIFSPDGWYFILCKGGWILSVPEPSAVGGIYIAIEFYIIQTLAFILAKIIMLIIKLIKKLKSHLSKRQGQLADGNTKLEESK